MSPMPTEECHRPTGGETGVTVRLTTFRNRAYRLAAAIDQEYRGSQILLGPGARKALKKEQPDNASE